MNEEKARDFFSAYYEGVLEPGLRQTLERRLSVDAQLQAEYRTFERTMRELSDLRLEEIEIPYDLHDVISARVDRSIYERGRRAPSGLAGYWRNLAFGAVALAAIVGAIYSLPKPGGSSVGGNALLATGSGPITGNKVDFRVAGNAVSLEVTPNSEAVLTIDSKEDGKTLQRSPIHSGDHNVTPLANAQPTAAMVEVKLSNEAKKRLVALPGKEKSESASGEGDLAAFALAAAGYYGEPILIDVRNPNMTVHWSLADKDAARAVATVLSDTHLKVEQIDGAPLTIKDPN